MAAESSSSCSSVVSAEALAYALSKLGKPELVLKEEQKLAMFSLFSGNDVFVWLPTGFGKSICFQTLPFMFDYKLGLVKEEVKKRSLLIVVAPLVALMVDQAKSLQDSGVRAVIVSSGGRENRIPESLLETEETLMSASLAFCSPESLVQDKWRDILEKPSLSDRVCAIVVDECHCISKW